MSMSLEASKGWNPNLNLGKKLQKDDHKGRGKEKQKVLEHLQAWLYGCKTCAWALEGLIFGLMLCVSALNLLMLFKQEASNFHFALGCTNCVAGPEFQTHKMEY